MSKLFAVLGSPISHSKSPAIHGAAYRVLNEEWSYGRFEVVRGGLKRFIENEGSTYSGFSVTMPLKGNAFSFADETDDLSKLTKATNTLVLSNGKWLGFNTDIFGITQSVGSKLSSPMKSALIIGSGATATSSLVAIAQLSPTATVKIFARNKQAAKDLVAFGKSLNLEVRRTRFLISALAKADLVISTLPGGALDDVAKKLTTRTSFKPKGLLLDVAYSPWPSALATVWSGRGCPVASGKDMLIWQALAQIRIFKNGNPSEPLLNEVAVLEAMRIAADE